MMVNESSKKAERRKHKERMKKKALKLYGYREAIKYADHLCACSCAMCGHKRKILGRPIQELRRIDPKESREEIND